MDIDDLLAEVEVDATPQETRDLQELTRAWVAERSAPEILSWPEELMGRVLERIGRQVRVLAVALVVCNVAIVGEREEGREGGGCAVVSAGLG